MSLSKAQLKISAVLSFAAQGPAEWSTSLGLECQQCQSDESACGMIQLRNSEECQLQHVFAQ